MYEIIEQMYRGKHTLMAWEMASTNSQSAWIHSPPSLKTIFIYYPFISENLNGKITEDTLVREKSAIWKRQCDTTTKAIWWVRASLSKPLFLLVLGVIICEVLLPVRAIARLQHPSIEAGCLKTWMFSNSSWFQALVPFHFATLARFPYNRRFHKFSALADKFHTRTTDDFI